MLSQALKSIKTSEFMPYVVFIAAPSIEMMRSQHELARQRGRSDKIRTVSVTGATRTNGDGVSFYALESRGLCP